VDDYVAQSAAKKTHPNSWNFWASTTQLMVSLLKSWYGDAATGKRVSRSTTSPSGVRTPPGSRIYDQALKGKSRAGSPA